VLGSREPRPNAPNCNAAAIEPNIRSQKPEINTRWVAMFGPRRIRYLELPFSRKFSMVRRPAQRRGQVCHGGIGAWGALESIPRARRCYDHSSPPHLGNSSGLDLRVRPCKTSHLQSLLYSTFQAISLSVNYGIFSALVLTGGLWRSYLILAAAVGSLIAAVLS